MDVNDVARDLFAEQEALDAVVATLDEGQWALATASPRWSVADQIGHLAYFDGTAAQAIVDPEGFAVAREYLLGSFSGDPHAVDRATLGPYRAMPPSELQQAWRANRRALATAAAALDNDTRVEWYGPSMGAKSFLTARLMEAWAHGQHICDAVGATRQPTDRLRHVAQLGVITRGWTYINRGIEAPVGEVRVELRAPSDDSWVWGPEDAAATVSGSAIDFCLVVTQCRHVDDTNLTVTGDVAWDWLQKAQAFAGPATDGPQAGGMR